MPAESRLAREHFVEERTLSQAWRERELVDQELREGILLK